jgi:deltex
MQWEYECDEGNWARFSSAESRALDTAYVNDNPFEFLPLSGRSVTFERIDALQINMETGMSRPARRVSSELWEARLAPQEWVAYPAEISREIEDAFAAHLSSVQVTFAVDGSSYEQEYMVVFGQADGVAQTPSGLQRVRRSDELVPRDDDMDKDAGNSGPAMGVALSRYCRSTEALPDHCSICLCEDTSNENAAVELVLCGHAFHEACIRAAFASKPECPLCKRLYDVIEGNMPTDGNMDVDILLPGELPLSGYETLGTILIRYILPNGVQGPEHPNPGTPYSGTVRTAFLPDNADGQEVLRLLRVAWERRLTFTIGRSLTTGRENTVTWNGIHHKTCPDGGTVMFGWPDPEYFCRVKSELSSFGIR